MKKFLAIIMAVAMIASLSSVLFAADEKGPSPIAAYDFTGKKLADTTGKQADIILDEEPLNEDGSEVRTDDERKAGHSGRATATDDGINMMNGFFKLPEDMFSKAENINGLTVSITYTKNSDYGWGGTWSEHLIAFSDTWMNEELKNEDGSMNYDDRANSFFVTRNGNVATSKTPYSADGSWIDGSLGEDYAKDGTFATVTVTFDLKNNVAYMYLDGELVKTSEESDWEKKAVLTADLIKSFKYGAVGIPVGGDWGMWGFFTVKDLTVYADTLTAEQVKTLATSGWQAVASGATPPATEGNKPSEGDKPTAPQTGFATVALAVAAIGSGAYIVSKKRH